MKKSLPILFMGTSRFAVPILQTLNDHYHLVAVITQPDRPSGRGRPLSMPPVKELSLELGIPVLQPENIRNPSLLDETRKLEPRLIVVAAYGKILPRSILNLPEMGCINIHASLLPRYRGAAPIHWAIAQGESITGVTTILMDEGMDTGPILLSREVPIDPGDTTGSLMERLARAGAEIILETIQGLERGDLRARLQDSSKATYAPPFKKQDGWLDWKKPAIILHNHIRALNPWPGTFTHLEGKVLKVFKTELDENPDEERGTERPGCVAQTGPEGIRVATGNGLLILKEIQLEGKKRLLAREFLMGYRLGRGTMFH